MSITKRKHKHRRIRSKKRRGIKNWSSYNKGLKKRGDITIWFTPDAIKKWYYKGKKGHGGHLLYTDHTLLICRTIGMVFRQALRQQEGFVNSLLKILKGSIKAPDYSVVSRRSGGIQKELYTLKTELDKARGSRSGCVEMIVDSTGIKIYGEGEWMTKKHKTKVRKSWMKLHLSAEKDGWINANTLTDHLTSDTSQVAPLRAQIKKEIDRFTGDGAYDSRELFMHLMDKNSVPPELIVPPKKGAILSDNSEFMQRNDHIIFMDKHGRDAWEIKSGYTMQSKAENTFFRFKTIIGRKLASRVSKNQQTEANLGCLILNKMHLCGMPKYES